MTQEIQKAKRLWSEKQMKSSRGLWGMVKTLRGSRGKEPWQRLQSENNGLDELLRKLTEEFHANFNSDTDVDLNPLSNDAWDFFITPVNVFHHLSKLSQRKAAGPDQIPSLLWKAGAKFLCSPLASIFNKSIETRTFPFLFKHAHVCPIPKVSNPKL